MNNRACPQCGEIIYGRSDKKFCDDGCRNLHINKLNSDTTNYVRNVNNTLRKNRRILEQLVAENATKIPWQALALGGFNFSYCTHVKTTKEGKTYYYCYEYGYERLRGQCVLIKEEPQAEKMFKWA